MTMKKHKTKTGALPNSAGFPGTNMIDKRGFDPVCYCGPTSKTVVISGTSVVWLSPGGDLPAVARLPEIG